MMKICAYKSCNTQILANSSQYSKKRFCCDQCRKYSHRMLKGLSSRLERRKANLRLNSEFRYLVAQCRRAGTIEILHGHTLLSFIETMDLVRNKPRGDVELCHIFPVKGKGYTGLFHVLNLFYGGAYQNRKLGKKHLGGGLSIRNEDLKSKWEVSKSMTSDEILVQIENYLGGIINEYIKLRPVRRSRKTSIAEKISALDPSADFDYLMMRSHKELAELWAALSHTSPYVLHPGRESKYLAYMDGLTRFIYHDKTRRKMLKSIRRTMVIGYMALERVKISDTYNKEFYIRYEPLINLKYAQATFKDSKSWSVFKDLIYDTVFCALHGAKIDAKSFKKQVLSYLYFPV